MNRLASDKFVRTATLIRARRKELGLSQGDLAKTLGLKSNQFISNMERGLCGVPQCQSKAITKTLKIEVKDLAKAMARDYYRRYLSGDEK